MGRNKRTMHKTHKTKHRKQKTFRGIRTVMQGIKYKLALSYKQGASIRGNTVFPVNIQCVLNILRWDLY